jgi:acetyl coenzyme A synthetase (ADP forming)-like protein
MEKRLLTEEEGYSLLKKHGIPVPLYRFVQSPEEAIAAATEIGYPVVVKVVSAQIIHKTDAGGVCLGITDNESLSIAIQQINERIRAFDPDALISGYIVEEEIKKGTELLIGGRIDPAFGKVLTVGMGGILVELLHDFSMRILPVDPHEFRRMIRELRGYQLISGYRGSKALDEEALLEVIRKSAAFFLEHSDVIEFDINPLILWEQGSCAVDSRIFVQAGEIELPPAKPVLPPVPDLLHPRSIAVIGASRAPGKVGYAVFRNLLNFQGELYAVNPNADEIMGKKVFPSIESIPDPVEMIVIATPAQTVPEIIRKAGEKQVKSAVILTAGFRETGDEGKVLEDEILSASRKTGIRIVGPNCLGIIIPPLSLNATFDVQSPLSGYIGFISQSGAIITTVLDWSISRRIGFSSVISVGNQTDMGFLEYLQVLDQDPQTYAVILYVEEIRNGWEFLMYAESMRGRKPVIALKSGSSVRGREAASSHTGSLSGSYETYIAAFKQSGIIPVYSLDEAFDVATLVVSEGYPAGKRTLIVTNAGGFGVLGADYAEMYGLEMIVLPDEMIEDMDKILPDLWSHKNPVDIIGDSNASRFARIFDIMIKYQSLWDIAVIITAPVAMMDPKNLAHEMIRLSRFTHAMVIGCLLGGDSMKSAIDMLGEAHIPNYQNLQDAFRTVGAVIESSCKNDG